MPWNPTPGVRAIHMAWVRHALRVQRLGVKPMTFEQFVNTICLIKFDEMQQEIANAC